MGLALLAGGTRDDAAAHFRLSASLAPGHALAHAQTALLLLQGGRSAEALAFARRAVELRGERADFKILLGAALRGTPGGIEESRAVLQAAVAEFPGNAEAWLQLGMTLSLIPEGRTRAVESLRRAAEIDPSSEAAWRALAAVLASIAGREDEARMAVERADDLGRGGR